MALEPPSPGIGPIACDLQRSVNILILPLDAAADDADDAHAQAIMLGISIDIGIYVLHFNC